MVRREVDSIVAAVEIKDELVITANSTSSGRGPNSVVQNPNETDFSGNAKDMPLMMSSSPADLNVNETTIEEGSFPALRSNFDRNASHHFWA